MKYDRDKEKELLLKTNERLVEYLKEIDKDTLTMTAIGNSISNGFSLSEPGRLLLDRNLELIEVGKGVGLDVSLNHLARSENNNGLIVADWIIRGCSEEDTYVWNKADYSRFIEGGSPLLSEDEIAEYFYQGCARKIQDIIFNNDDKEANVVILNLGTGSFLDVVTRHGSISIPCLFGSIERDMRGVSQILELIQNNNRENKAHTQVYLCGAPRIMNTFITDIFMNSKIRKLGGEYANVTYIPSFPRQAFYKTKSGKILPDPHYNQAEYFHLLSLIEEGIVQNYIVRDLMIDLDNMLFLLSSYNDIYKSSYGTNDALDIIRSIARKNRDKGGDYNDFLDMVKNYIETRYPFDFYRLAPEKNLADMVDYLKLKR